MNIIPFLLISPARRAHRYRRHHHKGRKERRKHKRHGHREGGHHGGELGHSHAHFWTKTNDTHFPFLLCQLQFACLPAVPHSPSHHFTIAAPKRSTQATPFPALHHPALNPTPGPWSQTISQSTLGPAKVLPAVARTWYFFFFALFFCFTSWFKLFFLSSTVSLGPIILPLSLTWGYADLFFRVKEKKITPLRSILNILWREVV